MGSEIISQQLILWDGYNLTTRLTRFLMDDGTDALEDTTLGCTTHSNAVGLFNPAIQIEGIYDAATYDEALYSTMGGSDVLISILRSGTSGALAYFLNAMHASYEPVKGAVGELAGFSAGGVAQGDPLIRGQVLSNNTNLTTTSNGSTLQLPTVGAAERLYAGLHVLAIDDNGGDTLDVTIESDSANNFPTPITRITFDQMTDIGSQFKSVAGAITDTYYRPVYTITGSTPAFAAVVVIGTQ